MRTVSVAPSQPYDGQGLSNHLIENDTYYALTELADITATAFSQKGMATLASLAKTLTRRLALQFQPMSAIGKPIGAVERPG